MKQLSRFFYGLVKGVIPLMACLAFLPTDLAAQVSGSVFRDFNGNGSKEANEPLMPGITVNAYNAAGTLCGSAVSGGSTSPNYTLNGCGTGPVRVEFILPSSGNACVTDAIDYPGMGGASYGSSMQFVNGNSTNVNFAVHNPADYNNGASNPMIYIPCYVNGDPLAGGNSGSSDWFVGLPYNSTGTSGPPFKLSGQVIGSTWGVAYSRQAQKIFTSAFLKRHIGLGAMGSGGIYMLQPSGSSFTVTQFFDMDNNAFNTASNPVTRTRAGTGAPAYGNGSSFTLNGANTIATYNGAVDPQSGAPIGLGVIGTNAQRGLPANATGSGVESYDPAAFDQVGKVGLGGIAISEDGRYLFVMNLYSRKLYRLELNDPYNPTAVVAVTEYALPSTSCSNGVLRPFAVNFFRNKVYVGAVCSGETGGQNIVNGATDLYAYVFELGNPTGTASFAATPVLNFPLNYRKGPASASTSDGTNQWYAWTNDVTRVFGASPYVYSPQPVLSDIDFSDRGDLVMSFLDRYGHQAGYFNRQFLGAANTGLVDARVGGELLIAGFDCSNGQFTMESAGQITSINGQTFSSGAPNNQGIGGSEFFKGEFHPYHYETSQGALAVQKGLGDIVATVMDPLTVYSGGGRRLSTTNGGAVNNGFQLYDSYSSANGTQGKANGLGDIDLYAVESPIEIGNRVWYDQDADGIQDAGENGIAGVTVQLLKNGSVIATAVTDAQGRYYFSSAPGTNTASAVYNISQLQPGMAYTVRIPNANGSSQQTPLLGYLPTVANTGAGAVGSQEDLRDSDGTVAGTNFEAAVSTSQLPGEGANNHSFDFGFLPGVTIGSTVFADRNDDGIQSGPLEPGIAGVTVYLLRDANNNGTIDPSEQTPVDTVVTDASGNYLFENLPEGNYQVVVPTPDPSAQVSSTGQNTTDGLDGTDDGAQASPGGPTSSPVTNLTGGTEPTGASENYQGGNQDVLADSYGDMTLDFGFVPTMSIGSTVFADSNHDGVQSLTDPLEHGIPNVPVYLYYDQNNDGVISGSEATTPVLTTTTDANGNYYFGNLPEGVYQVGILPPGGTPISSAGASGDDGVDGNDNGDQPGGSGTPILSSPITLVGGTEPTTESRQGSDQDNANDANGDMSVDFGLVPIMSIGSTAFYDRNNDGVQSGILETGIAGMPVQLLYDANRNGIIDPSEETPVRSTVTDANGNYYFGNLLDGKYQVLIPTPDLSAPASSTGQNSTIHLDGTDDGAQTTEGGPVRSPVVMLMPGGEPTAATETYQGGNQDDANDANGNMTVDFGFVPTMSIGSSIFADSDNDGIQDVNDPLEMGLPNVPVDLFFDANNDGVINGLEATTPVLTTTTDQNGQYLFDRLPEGNYMVAIHPPASAQTSSAGAYPANGTQQRNAFGRQPGQHIRCQRRYER
jgi:hypothetical protein